MTIDISGLCKDYDQAHKTRSGLCRPQSSEEVTEAQEEQRGNYGHTRSSGHQQGVSPMTNPFKIFLEVQTLRKEKQKLEDRIAALEKERNELSRGQANIEQMMLVLRDLNAWSQSLVEIRRLDPARLFEWSPK